MVEAGIAAAVGAIIGAIGVAVVNIIKAIKQKNETRQQEYEHAENLIKIVKGTEELSDSIKELDKKVDQLNDRLDTMSAEQKELNIAMLRHDITFAARKEALTQEEKQSILALYDQYKKLGGNSFVEGLLKEKEILK